MTTEDAPRVGVLHPLDQAPYDLVVKERDYERVRCDRLTAERDAALAEVERLQPLSQDPA